MKDDGENETNRKILCCEEIDSKNRKANLNT